MPLDTPAPPTGAAVLSTPLTLPCGVTLPNRLAKAAMSELLADPQNRATPAHQRLYGTWAKGGPGMLLTGNVQIDYRHLEHPGNVVIQGAQDAGRLAALKAWSATAKREGAQTEPCCRVDAAFQAHLSAYLPGGGIPDSHGAVPFGSDCDPGGVRGDCHRGDFTVVPAEGCEQFPCGCEPDSYGALRLAGGDKPGAIGSDRHRGIPSVVTRKGGALLT